MVLMLCWIFFFFDCECGLGFFGFLVGYFVFGGGFCGFVFLWFDFCGCRVMVGLFVGDVDVGDFV